MDPRFHNWATLGADKVLGWTPEQQQAVRAWLAEAVGEQTMRDTYEVQIVNEGRICVRFFVRGTDGQFVRHGDDLLRESVTLDWPTPPPVGSD